MRASFVPTLFDEIFCSLHFRSFSLGRDRNVLRGTDKVDDVDERSFGERDGDGDGRSGAEFRRERDGAVHELD